ncbi:TPR domain-containing protein [Brachyspira hampsonii 30599]|nr:TPR domain-containing protein [Brachyspira hampsonii 30599]
MKLDIEYLKNVSNNFIIKKHNKNFIKNPLSYYDKEKLILKLPLKIKTI